MCCYLLWQQSNVRGNVCVVGEMVLGPTCCVINNFLDSVWLPFPKKATVSMTVVLKCQKGPDKAPHTLTHPPLYGTLPLIKAKHAALVQLCVR